MTASINRQLDAGIAKHIFNNKRLLRLTDKVVRRFPNYDQNFLSYQIKKKYFERYMKEKLGKVYREVDPGPVAPDEIILKTNILEQNEVAQKTNPYYYHISGYAGMLSWLKLLEKYSFNLRTTGSIMEFGCGSARLIRHLRGIQGIRLVGTDADANSIQWCQDNVSGIEFYVNEFTPPLVFAEDNSFDLVFACSVFTHIPWEHQYPWAEEIYRILRPGGYFLCSVHGPYHEQFMLRPQDREKLGKAGHLTLGASDQRASLSTQVIGGCDIFITRAEVLKMFGSIFYVHDYISSVQDTLILQKI